uniref:Uncharacterized protein n=1 Tax=Electrophorus electricus TaxID=8005 RepID=A0A4W4EJK0_ELEEL
FSMSNLLSDDHLLCSICLDVLNEPVTTACGHNFCRTYLTQYWNKDEVCPYCKQTFTRTPELKINTTLKEVVDHFRMKSGGLNKPEVLCDYCTGVKLKALKSCLVCLTSYCETHLEPHQNISALKKHKLINPVKNLESYICQKHERPLELFCRDDQMCVCQFYTEIDRKTHRTVPVEEESRQKKTQLGKSKTELQQMVLDRLKKIEEVKLSVELRKKKKIADSVEVFTTLIRSIERSQAELLQVMEEKQKAAERRAEGLIKDLEQEITDLKRRDTELEQLSHTEDHLHLLQVTLSSPPHTKNWTDTDVNEETVRKALSQLQKTLNEKLFQTLIEKLKETVDVTLDPDTARSHLILSDDGKQVTHGDTEQNLPDNTKRFNWFFGVLGKKRLSSGRFYYEVQVRRKTDWDVGMARESVDRKGTIWNSENGYWTIDEGLILKEKLQSVVVFVDYEMGLVSFYDVKARSHIYSFTCQSFSEKLYPVFNPFYNNKSKNSASLITPVTQSKLFFFFHK